MSQELYHFTDYSGITGIIRAKYFRPSYSLEKIDYFDRNSITKTNANIELLKSELAFPMVCFADLMENEIDKHSEKFGDFALVMSKDWARNNRLSPVLYANPKGITSDGILRSAINLYIDILNTSSNEDQNIALRNILSFLMIYYKSYEGFEYCKAIKDFKDKPTTFYLEREWRYVPMHLNNCAMSLTYEKFIVDTVRNEEIRKIDNNHSNRLKFEFQDVLKIITPHEHKQELIHALAQSFEIDIETSEKKFD